MRKRRILLSLLIFAAAAFSCNFSQDSVKRVPVDTEKLRVLEGKQRYTILVFGDFGTGTGQTEDPQLQVSRAMSGICKKRGCDFTLGLGDNFYPNGVTSAADVDFVTKFEEPYRDLQFPFFMTLGNHDYHINPFAQTQFRSSRWNMPKNYYRVPGLPSWFKAFAMDTNQLDEKQLQTIESEMCSGESSESTGWKVIFGHHPIFSNGGHYDNREMQKKLLPLIRKCGIQLMLAGHDHHLESITTPDFEEVISGTAGDVGYAERRQRPEVTQNFVASSLGFVVMDAEAESILISFYGVDERLLFERRIQR